MINSLRSIPEPENKLDILTLADVAELLHCSKAHICNIVNGNVKDCLPIPIILFGRRKLIRRESLLQWLKTTEHFAKSDSLTTLLVRDAGKRG